MDVAVSASQGTMGAGAGSGGLAGDEGPAKGAEQAPQCEREERVEPSLTYTRALLTYFAFGTMFILGHSRVRGHTLHG